MEKPRVLIIEDNPATSTLVTALLHREFLVELAGDGLDAIEKLKSRAYSAVLLDLLMPVADGYSVLDFLSAERPEMLPRVLVVTASLSHKELERIGRYPVCGVVRKPFEVETLLTAVKSCVRHDGASPSLGPIVSSGMIMLLADLLRRV